MTQLENLTICSVSYRSADMLRMNMALTAELNPQSGLQWIIVDNSDDFYGAAPEGSLLLKGDPCQNMGELRGSYHHAQALNKAIQHVDTRYVLVLDPDFFIIRRQWIYSVLKHVQENDIVLWGAPYIPSANWKRRYVPAAYCMLIDLKKYPKKKVDFTPELDEYHILKTYSTLDLIRIRMGKIQHTLKHMDEDVLKDISRVILQKKLLLNVLTMLFPNRFYSNTNIARDTGFKIQKHFSGLRHDVETLQPYYVNDLFTPKKNITLNLFASLYALLVPETFSIYPKRRGYTTTLQFKDFNLPDLNGLFGWEEYFWKGLPFALHIKSGTRKIEEIGNEKLMDILSKLTRSIS